MPASLMSPDVRGLGFKREVIASDHEAALALGDRLYAAFPKAFVHPRLCGKGMRPLKVGIDKDIKSAFPEVPKRVIKAFLRFYTRSRFYMRCGTMVGTPRVDLDGNAVAVVIPGHARNSTRHLERIDKQKSRAKDAPSDRCQKTGKITFNSLDEAAAVGRFTLARAGGDLANACGYRCGFCGHFHWGNLSPKGNLR